MCESLEAMCVSMSGVCVCVVCVWVCVVLEADIGITPHRPQERREGGRERVLRR